MEILNTKTFVIEEDAKAQALKVLEEAAELVEAVKCWEVAGRSLAFKTSAVEEAADVMQATLNLLDMMGLDRLDVLEAMRKCKDRNMARGRYAQAMYKSVTEPTDDGRAELLLAVADDIQKEIDATEKFEAFGEKHIVWPPDHDKNMKDYVERIRRAVS